MHLDDKLSQINSKNMPVPEIMTEDIFDRHEIFLINECPRKAYSCLYE